jgi:hypothetical protein
MSKSETLNRIILKNKAAKVRKLSDIALLFEKESRLSAQAMELDQFENKLLEQTESKSSELNQLPRDFVRQEQVKRDKLLSTLEQCRQEIVGKSTQFKDQQKLQLEELQRIDARIKAVQEKARYEHAIVAVSKEVLESEDCVRNV